MSDEDDDDQSLSSDSEQGETNNVSAEESNRATLYDILSANVLNHLVQGSRNGLSKHARKKQKKSAPVVQDAESQAGPGAGKDAEELAEFLEYLAAELFASLPGSLQSLDQHDDNDNEDDAEACKTREQYAVPLDAATLGALLKPAPPEVLDGIQTCIADSTPSKGADATELATTRILQKTLDDYCEAVNPPPALVPDLAAQSPHRVKLPSKPKDAGCQLCQRAWIPLTAHHLIPRAAHAKAIKRGWHTPQACVTSIAWLCRACHSFVHGLASNEELAREWYAVELLAGREDVQRWVSWVSRVRWKAR